MAIYGNMVVPSKAAGGALPTDNSDRNVYVPGTEVSARYSDAGGVLAAQGQQKAAEGLGNLGKGLGALAGMGMALYTRQRRIEHAEAMEAVARLQTEYIEKQREWSQIKGANALNMEELKSRWWDEAMPRLTQGLSDYGQRYFNLNADRVGAMADTFIQNHQEREIGQYEGQQLKLAMDSEGNMIAANPFDPAAAAASQGRIRALIHQEAVRKGWTHEMEEQAFLAASGKAWGNAIAVRISMGDFEGANRLMMQYGASVSPEDQAKLRQSWSAGKMGLLAAYAGAGKVDAIRRELDGNGAQSLNARLEVGAGATLGEKYTWGKNDCSGHTCQIWQAALGDSPAKTAIFGRDGAHTTAAEIMRNAYNYTHKLYQGTEINPASVKGGWLLATTGQGHAVREGRWNNIGHIVTTYEKGDGSIWVSEASSTSGQVTMMPLQRWLASQKRPLLGVDLSSLQPGPGGALPGGYKGVPSGGTVNVLPQYKPMLEQAARQAGVDPVLLQAIAMQESDGGRDLRTSKAGAVGLMQIMPSVAREIGGNRDNMQDNIRMGAQYFAKMLKMSGGDVREALLRYNWGPGNVDAWKKTGKGVNGQEMPQEAQEYADRVLGHIKGGSVGAQPQQQTPAQGASAAPTLAGNLSDNAKAIYDLMAQQVGDGRMTRQQAEARLQEMLQSAKAKMSSSDEPVRKMAKGDYRDIQAAIAAFRQGQSSQAPAPAPAQAPAMPQAGAQQAQGMGAGFQLTEAEQQRARNEYEPQAYASDAWKRLEVLPLEKLDSGLREELRAFSGNPKMQAQVSNLLSPMVEQQKKFLVAKENQLITEWVGKIQGENYLGARNTINMAVENKQLTMEQGAKVLDARFGKREDTMETRAAAYDIKKRIDNKDIKSLAEVESACLAAHCTNAQIHECRDWFEKGGVAGHITTSHVETLWRSVMKKSSSEKMPPEVLSFVQKAVPPGKVPTEDDLKHAIQLAYTSGEGWSSGEAYKAAAEGKEDWIPKGANTDEMRAEAVRRLREDDHVKGLLSDAQINAKIRQMHGLPWGVKKDRGAK